MGSEMVMVLGALTRTASTVARYCCAVQQTRHYPLVYRTSSIGLDVFEMEPLPRVDLGPPLYESGALPDELQRRERDQCTVR